MTSHDVDRAAFLTRVKAAIDADRQNARKWQPLYDWFEETFAVRGGRGNEVGAKLLTEDKQLSNRIRKELGEFNSQYVVLAGLDDVSLDDAVRFLQETSLPRLEFAIVLRNRVPKRILIAPGADARDQVVARLLELFPDIQSEAILVAPLVGGIPTAGAVVAAGPMSLVPILVGDRVRRMVRLAIASTPAVILVGVPGTGKTTLLKQTLDEIQADPASFGFTTEINDPRWETPEESWTARELIGGETVDDKGRLRFRPGHVLNSVREDRWLVLDETNRADMDKIFGGLLTWLSGHSVGLGKASTHLDSPNIRLEWGADPTCSTENFDQLEEDHPTGESIRFLAGTEWRLLGTYNALDAQRVFRFGEALGRRFARVPIPAPTPDQFQEAIAPVVDGMPDQVGLRIGAMYAAHYSSEATILGPALFMRIPDYVRHGLASIVDPAIRVTELSRLIAEAYVVHVGPWLARLEEADLDDLRSRLLLLRAFDEPDWVWTVGLLPALGRLG